MSDYSRSFSNRNSKKLSQTSWFSEIYKEIKYRLNNFDKNLNLNLIEGLYKLQSSLNSLHLIPLPLSYGNFSNSNSSVLLNKRKLRNGLQQFKSKIITILIIYILLVVPFLTLTNLFSHKTNQDVKPAEAMSFKSSWNSTINSISTSNHKINTSEPKFSYINPYLDYPNLNKTYQNDPQYTQKLVERIGQYIDDNKSRDSFDNGFGSPVKAEFYLETAIKYHVPIDQMLAVARSESRFGTDCYTSSGAMTRICNFKNIFSIGLTESSSIGFNSWEDGVEAFGRLYQNRKDRGFDDCGIWRIYNPNGDYCAKILDLASKVRVYLDRE